MIFDFFFSKADSNATKAYFSALASARHHFHERFLAPSDNAKERIEKFESIAIFMALNLWYLKRQNSRLASKYMKSSTDFMFDQFEIAMREQCVSDIRINPEIKKLASAFNGRLKAYEEGFDAKDAALIANALQRNHVCDKSHSLKLGIYLSAQARKIETLPMNMWLDTLDEPTSDMPQMMTNMEKIDDSIR